MGVQNQIYAHKIKLVGGTKELSRNPEYSPQVIGFWFNLNSSSWFPVIATPAKCLIKLFVKQMRTHW